MTVSEMIEKLREQPEDANVYFYADHGDQAESANNVDYMCLDCGDILDINRVDDPSVYKKVVVIT